MCPLTGVVDRHRVDALPDPDFHFDAHPDPDTDGHQNDADPHVDPTHGQKIADLTKFGSESTILGNLGISLQRIYDDINDFMSVSLTLTHGDLKTKEKRAESGCSSQFKSF